jgi:hypothetical protein
MKINLHIERLILDGLPVNSHDGPQVRAAVQAELSRLLGSQGFSEELQAGGAFPAVRARPIHLESQAGPRQIGRQIAHSVYRGLCGKR